MGKENLQKPCFFVDPYKEKMYFTNDFIRKATTDFASDDSKWYFTLKSKHQGFEEIILPSIEKFCFETLANDFMSAI